MKQITIYQSLSGNYSAVIANGSVQTRSVGYMPENFEILKEFVPNLSEYEIKQFQPKDESFYRTIDEASMTRIKEALGLTEPKKETFFSRISTN